MWLLSKSAYTKIISLENSQERWQRCECPWAGSGKQRRRGCASYMQVDWIWWWWWWWQLMVMMMMMIGSLSLTTRFVWRNRNLTILLFLDLFLRNISLASWSVDEIEKDQQINELLCRNAKVKSIEIYLCYMQKYERKNRECN